MVEKITNVRGASNQKPTEPSLNEEKNLAENQLPKVDDRIMPGARIFAEDLIFGLGGWCFLGCAERAFSILEFIALNLTGSDQSEFVFELSEQERTEFEESVVKSVEPYLINTRSYQSNIGNAYELSKKFLLLASAYSKYFRSRLNLAHLMPQIKMPSSIPDINSTPILNKKMYETVLNHTNQMINSLSSNIEYFNLIPAESIKEMISNLGSRCANAVYLSKDVVFSEVNHFKEYFSYLDIPINFRIVNKLNKNVLFLFDEYFDILKIITFGEVDFRSPAPASPLEYEDQALFTREPEVNSQEAGTFDPSVLDRSSYKNMVHPNSSDIHLNRSEDTINQS